MLVPVCVSHLQLQLRIFEATFAYFTITAQSLIGVLVAGSAGGVVSVWHVMGCDE